MSDPLLHPHPHGSRTPSPEDEAGKQDELTFKNIAELFRRVQLLENKLSALRSWKEELRAGKNITINGNVISAADPPPTLPPALLNADVCDTISGTATAYNFVIIPSVGGAP